MYPRPSTKFVSKGFSGLKYNIYYYTLMTDFEKAVQKVVCPFDNSKSKSGLGITYTPIDVSLTDTVASMIDTGFVATKK